MKQFALVGVLAGALAVPALAQEGVRKMPQPGQKTVAEAPAVPTGEMPLGSVRIPRDVTADGKPLKRGTYQVRLTAQQSKPDVVGQTPPYERWAEFLQGGKVVGREVVSIVPPSEIGTVAEDRQPRPGGYKVELLRGGEFYRVWINRDKNHFLIHLPPAGAASGM